MVLPALKGIIRGKVIELEREPGLPEGQSVTVTIQAAPAPGAAGTLRRLFGAWADDAADLDGFDDEVRRARKQERPEPAP